MEATTNNTKSDERARQGKIDLTTMPNNPAWDMKLCYKALMEACTITGTDSDGKGFNLGVAKACGILDDWVGHGISRENAMFWKRTLQKASEEGNWGGIRNDPVSAVQKAISDFILAAANLQAGRGGRPKRRWA